MSKITYKALVLFGVLAVGLTDYTLHAQDSRNSGSAPPPKATAVSTAPVAPTAPIMPSIPRQRFPPEPNIDVLEERVDANEQQRQKITHDLAEIASNLELRRTDTIHEEDAKDVKGREAVAAIILLGKLHADNYVERLECYLEVREQRLTNSRIPTIYDDYPAVGALSEIGYPAVQSILWLIADDYSAKRLPLVSAIIYRVVGKEVGLAFIDNQMAGNFDAKQINNLKKLRTYFQKRSAVQFVMGE